MPRRLVAVKYISRLVTPVLETERLTLRHASLDDDAFVLRLLNEPSFIQFIGDRGVRTSDDARRYIADRLLESYVRFGFGLWVVERKESPEPIGLSGLVKRDALEHPDIGFAFLPEFWGRGYAFEAAAAVKAHALGALCLPTLFAITNPDNAGSIRIVEKLGLVFERMITLRPNEPEARLFALGAPQ
jgi:[ribosomal protein S5]-alanine N-acetyltransferase